MVNDNDVARKEGADFIERNDLREVFDEDDGLLGRLSTDLEEHMAITSSRVVVISKAVRIMVSRRVRWVREGEGL